MWRFLFIGFLIAHGLIHLAVWATPASKDPKAPFDAAHSWLLGDQRPLATVIAFVASAILVVAGVGLWAHVEWWRPVAVTGLGLSLGLMVVWFNPWFLFIEAANAGLIAGIVWFSWPSRAVLGA